MTRPRAYLRHGRVAHLLPFGASLNHSEEEALCGASPGVGIAAAWYGSGDQFEHEHVEALPLCRRCEARS